MNLNVKLEGEEEQTIQYVNRFAINIPPTAFNLNIVNSGLSNQSYILNPVNPVGQNIVAYQSPMGLQSYFTLPAESEGNIIHGLPVGVPVPVGLPLQAGFLQNHNFVNTSIIIGNEDCNVQGVLNSSVEQVDDAKNNSMQKSMEEFINTSESHNVGLNCSPQINVEMKKPCPLEMSIKAANIDIEFEKCEQEIPSSVENHLEMEGEKSGSETGGNFVGDGSGGCVWSSPTHQSNEIRSGNPDEAKKSKTEMITWVDDSVKEKEIPSSHFHESLICEVEEVEEEDGCDDEFNCKINTESEKSFSREEKIEDSSSEESDVPLSLAMKSKKFTKCTRSETAEKKRLGKERNEISFGSKATKGKKGRKVVEMAESNEEWSESDDDALNLKLIKNDLSYKCFFEPKSEKSTNSTKMEDKSKKFTRVRSCCSKWECGKKISIKEQMSAHRFFHELGSIVERDSYLMNFCIEHVQKSIFFSASKLGKKGDEMDDVESRNIQMEIENESNGNKKLSDEIQNAINESLKDCIAAGGKEEEGFSGEDFPGGNGEREEKNSWIYYLAVDGCKKKVCLQFLLKLFRITKNRIKQLQKKILSGTPLVEESNFSKASGGSQQIWEMAKCHLDTIPGKESPNCNANPRHRFFKKFSREELFDDFKEFYRCRNGRDFDLKFPAYKRFLERETSVSFAAGRVGVCAECEDSKARKNKSNGNRRDSIKSMKPQPKVDGRTKKKKSDSVDSISDDEIPLKQKKLKLTLPAKAVNNSSTKSPSNQGKRILKSRSAEQKRGKGNSLKEKTKQSGSNRGRDVWSLMLLHLETMPYKEFAGCTNKKKHRFLDTTFTTQGLFEDYRKYFLKETNSELGLGFSMYEKYFNRNCNYSILDVNPEEIVCPNCANDRARS